MPISATQLDRVVQVWNNYAIERPREIKPRQLLKDRDISMYRGLRIEKAPEFAQALVEHRSVASLEMTMGHLFERLLEELGPTKVSKKDKKQPGYRGIDFLNRKPGLLEVITLKASLSTFNGDITRATVDNLTAAREFWEGQADADDNPLVQRTRRVDMVRAVARGAGRRTTTSTGILWLVGDALWDHFGAGPNLLQRLNEALGRNPLAQHRYEDEKKRATDRVMRYLQDNGLARTDGTLDWAGLIKEFP